MICVLIASFNAKAQVVVGHTDAVKKISVGNDSCICNVQLLYQSIYGITDAKLNVEYVANIMDSTCILTSDTCRKMLLTIKDCHGAATVQIMNKYNKISERGNYCGSDIMRDTEVNIFDDEGNITEVRKLYWYSPIKCGKWIYYDEKGIKIREEEF